MKNTAQHTPGPWTCKVGVMGPYVDQEQRTVRPHYVINQTTDGRYQSPAIPETEAWANARLIAMAPEMREALVLALRLMDEALPHFNWGASALDANAIQLLNEVPAQVRAVLAKGR